MPLAKVKVTQVPDGEQSQGVLGAWVGCVFSAQGPMRIPRTGVLSSFGQFEEKFYQVSRTTALDALEENGQGNVAEYWRALPNCPRYFLFGEEACEEVL